jgi:hypothetical protein
VDGCSINPSRSFGPAVVGRLRACPGFADGGLADLRIMFLGPMVGAALAAIAKTSFLPEKKSGAQVSLPDDPIPQPRAAGEALRKGAEGGEAPASVIVTIADDPAATTYGKGETRAKGAKPAAKPKAKPKVRNVVSRCLRCAAPSFT